MDKKFKLKKKPNEISLFSPEIRGNEWKYIKNCLDTAWVSSAGAYVGRFENTMADYARRKYAVACTSGTAALHTALLVMGIKPDDEVIVPALTFVATANSVRYTGAWPVFIDVEKQFWQIDIQKIKDFLTGECQYRRGRLINRRTGRTVKAVMPVDLLGHPADMDAVLKLARTFGLVVIEDAAAAVGSFYKKEPVGSLADIACFSFNGNKIVTAGGGGMIVTDHSTWAKKARYLTTQAKDDPIEHIHNTIGFNYRLTNIQAALGLAQMERLKGFLKIKRRIAKLYDDDLNEVNGISIPREAPWAGWNYWLYSILVDKTRYGKSSRDLLRSFQDTGIQTRPLWYPLHKQKPFQKCFAYRIEVTDSLYQDALSLPCSSGLNAEDQHRVISVVRHFKKKT